MEQHELQVASNYEIHEGNLGFEISGSFLLARILSKYHKRNTGPYTLGVHTSPLDKIIIYSLK